MLDKAIYTKALRPHSTFGSEKCPDLQEKQENGSYISLWARVKEHIGRERSKIIQV